MTFKAKENTMEDIIDEGIKMSVPVVDITGDSSNDFECMSLFHNFMKSLKNLQRVG
jgi:hypothetical protein